MLVSEIIYETLKTDFANRVAPHPIPEKFDKRAGVYVTYQKISTVPMDDDGGWTGHDLVRMRVSVFHEDSVECERAGVQVRWLMQDQSHCACQCDGADGDFDTETQLYYEQIDFLMWQSVC